MARFYRMGVLFVLARFRGLGVLNCVARLQSLGVFAVMARLQSLGVFRSLAFTKNPESGGTGKLSFIGALILNVCRFCIILLSYIRLSICQVAVQSFVTFSKDWNHRPQCLQRWSRSIASPIRVVRVMRVRGDPQYGQRVRW